MTVLLVVTVELECSPNYIVGHMLDVSAGNACALILFCSDLILRQIIGSGRLLCIILRNQYSYMTLWSIVENTQLGDPFISGAV